MPDQCVSRTSFCELGKPPVAVAADSASKTILRLKLNPKALPILGHVGFPPELHIPGRSPEEIFGVTYARDKPTKFLEK